MKALKVFRHKLTSKDDCNSMPFGAAWAYYGKVLVLANAASLNGRVRSKVKLLGFG